MKNKDFVVNGKKIGYYEDGMIVVTDPDIIKENQPEKTDRFTFGETVELLKAGNRMARKNWVDKYNNNNRSIYLVDGNLIPKEDLRGNAYEAFKWINHECNVRIRPHIDMRRDNDLISGWTPTTEDILAEDWFILS